MPPVYDNPCGMASYKDLMPVAYRISEREHKPVSVAHKRIILQCYMDVVVGILCVILTVIYYFVLHKIASRYAVRLAGAGF